MATQNGRNYVKAEKLMLEKVKLGLMGKVPRYVIEDFSLDIYFDECVGEIVYKLSTHFLAKKEKISCFRRLLNWIGESFSITPITRYKVCPHMEFPVPPKDKYAHILWLRGK